VGAANTGATWHDLACERQIRMGAGRSIVLHPPAAAPGVGDGERRTLVELVAEGSYASVDLASVDLDGVFERLRAADGGVVGEPTERRYGVRGCAFGDRAGELIRIEELVDG
jgi:hypothetical protein